MYYEAEISLHTPITVLAEWDTISAVTGSKFSFVQEKVPSYVQNAFLAIALDDKKWRFNPMLWKEYAGQPEGLENRAPLNGQTVKQCLFRGSHGDIGGGVLNAGLSTVSFLWMISCIESATDAKFDNEALLQPILPLPVLRGEQYPKYANLLTSTGMSP